MKRAIILSLVLIALVACQSQQPVVSSDDLLGADIVEESKVDEISENTTNVDMLSGVEKLAVSGNMVSYGNYSGYLAKPEGNHPGVIMIHEWWGLNEHIKRMADQLASEGYAVLAVDLYNGKVAENSSVAGALAGAVRNDSSDAINNMKSAAAYLKSLGSSKVASLGWCFGGQQSLQVSLREPVDATVIYYGNLVTDESNLSSLKSPVLGIFGDRDTGIPVESVKKFEAALKNLNISNEINIYPGVGHAFANPSGANYAPNETKDAWEKTLAFLNKNLK